MLLAAAEDDVDPLRLEPLRGRQQLAVEAELNDEVRLCPARELGVRDLVAVVAQVGSPVDPEEEIRMASEAVP